VLSGGRDAALVEATIAENGAPGAPAIAVPEADNSIAVLPFINMSDDANNEYFSDGLSEELLNLLAKIPELRVAARTSSFSFKGQQLEIPEIAARLKVGHVLEGSVRKAGNQVRVTAQLIKADDGFHLWSETYDRTLDNIFTVQDEIAAAVVDALKISLLGATPHVQEVNPEAFALYLQARFLANQRTQEFLDRAATAYRQALLIDPGYAAALAGLSTVTLEQAGQSYIEFGPGVDQARSLAERAIALAPDLAAGWSTLAQIQGGYDWDWNEAYASVQQALKLEPANADVLRQAARLAAALGNFTETADYLEQAVALDPLNYPAISALSSAYEQLDQLDKAETTIRSLINLNPDYSNAQVNLAYILLRKGEPEQALLAADLEPEEGWRVQARAFILYTLGRHQESDAELALFIDGREDFWGYQIAEIYAWRNQPDEAFQWLESAFQNRDPGMAALINDSSLRNLYSDARWEPMLAKMGLLEAWQAMPR
jgi:TolB-like protein